MKDGETSLKREPVRMCMACRERLPKRELERYVRQRKEGGGFPSDRESGTVDLIHDPGKRQPGRGFYICSKAECRIKFEKIRAGLKKKCKGENV